MFLLLLKVEVFFSNFGSSDRKQKKTPFKTKPNIMKKALLTICIGALTGFTSYAQGIEISLHGTTPDISGTIHMEATTTADPVEVSFDVTNTGTTTQDIIVTRVIMNEPSGWSNYFCWGHSTDPFGGTCYPPSANTIYVGANPATLAASEHGVLKCYVTPSSPAATPGVYRYYVGTTGTPKMDSIDLRVSSTLSLAPIKKDFSLSVSPNPASDYVNIEVSNLENGSMKIVDVLGNVVLSTSFNGKKTLNVEDYKNGVYFILISGDGVKSINRKLVVRH